MAIWHKRPWQNIGIVEVKFDMMDEHTYFERKIWKDIKESSGVANIEDKIIKIVYVDFVNFPRQCI